MKTLWLDHFLLPICVTLLVISLIGCENTREPGIIMWNNLKDTTWKKDNGWAGESYVFYEDDSGTKKCIHQIHGSGLNIVSRNYSDIQIVDSKKIVLDSVVFEYKELNLLSDKVKLVLEAREPLVSKRLVGTFDMAVVRKINFDPQNLD